MKRLVTGILLLTLLPWLAHAEPPLDPAAAAGARVLTRAHVERDVGALVTALAVVTVVVALVVANVADGGDRWLGLGLGAGALGLGAVGVPLFVTGLVRERDALVAAIPPPTATGISVGFRF